MRSHPFSLLKIKSIGNLASFQRTSFAYFANIGVTKVHKGENHRNPNSRKLVKDHQQK
jgi:hypothetical protein